MADLYDQLGKKLGMEVGRLSEAVASGACQDFASYRYEVGRIHGIQFAIGLLEELDQEMLTGDEDFR